MSSAQEVIILARLAGTRQFLADNQRLIAGQYQLAEATKMSGMAMEHASKRTWLYNQALFTLRRYTYYGTLALTGMGMAALKMGFDFNNAMQTATVALKPFYSNTEQLNGALNRLWLIAKYTPFQMKDMTTAFRALYPSFRELGISSDQTIDTIQALIDGLSVAGKVSGPALNRVTIGLQHMAFQGRLTGITVNQLARDGIPMFAILHKELGLNADQMHRIGQLGIPASVAMKAIIQYMQTTPGYAGAAMRQSRQTLIGLWSTFKDNVSRMAGMLEKDAFGRIQGRVGGLDAWFNRFFQHFNGQAVSMRQVLVYAFGGGAGVFWDQLSADLKLLWSIFSGLIKTIATSKAVWMTLFLALVALHGILIPINYFVQHFGWLLYVLIPLLIVWKTTQMAVNAQLAWEEFWLIANTKQVERATMMQVLFNKQLFVYRGAAFAARKATEAMTAAGVLQDIFMGKALRNANGTFAAYTNLQMAMKRLGESFRALKAGEFALAISKLGESFKFLWLWIKATATAIYEKLIPAFIRTRIAAFRTAIAEAATALATMLAPAFDAVAGAASAAWVAITGPVGLIVIAIIAIITVLVVLYLRWKWFHNAVNATAKFMWDHPILLWFVPIVGQLLFTIRMVWYFKSQIALAFDWILRAAKDIVKFMWDHPILLWLIPVVGWVLFVVRMLTYLRGHFVQVFNAMLNAAKAFVNFLWDHPILLLFIPFVGWLAFAARMIWQFRDKFVAAFQWMDRVARATWDKMLVAMRWVRIAFSTFVDAIKMLFAPLGNILVRPFVYMFHTVRHILNWIGDKLGGLGRKLGGLLGHIPGAHFFSKYVLGLAEGGTLRQPSWTMVGERGPELLLLPGGASVLPLPTTQRNANRFYGPQAAREPEPRQVFKMGQGYTGDWSPDRPLVIQLMLGKKVLEEVTVDKMAARQARR